MMLENTSMIIKYREQTQNRLFSGALNSKGCTFAQVSNSIAARWQTSIIFHHSFYNIFVKCTNKKTIKEFNSTWTLKMSHAQTDYETLNIWVMWYKEKEKLQQPRIISYFESQWYVHTLSIRKRSVASHIYQRELTSNMKINTVCSNRPSKVSVTYCFILNYIIVLLSDMLQPYLWY